MKTLALRSLIVSITLSALVGIYVLVVGPKGELEAKVLVTALSVSAVSILAMACGVAYERGRLGALPLIGTATSMLSFILFMTAIWTNTDMASLWKTAMTLLLIGIASAHSCLISLATLAARFRWTRWLGYTTAFTLAAILTFMIWGEVQEGEVLNRILGVLAILLGAATVTVPVLHRMSASDVPPPAVIEGPSVRFCVACGQGINGGAEPAACSRCGARFRVELLP